MSKLKEAADNLEAAADAVANIDFTQEKDAVSGFITAVADTLTHLSVALEAARTAFLGAMLTEDQAPADEAPVEEDTGS